MGGSRKSPECGGGRSVRSVLLRFAEAELDGLGEAGEDSRGAGLAGIDAGDGLHLCGTFGAEEHDGGAGRDAKGTEGGFVVGALAFHTAMGGWE